MKKRHRKKKHHRNAAHFGGLGRARRPRRRNAFALKRAQPPEWKTFAAAVTASLGSSLASGLLVNQQVVKPTTAALAMAAVGGVGAYVTDGNLRVALTGVASAGAGQLGLALLGSKALKDIKSQKSETDALAKAPAPPPAAPAPPARQLRSAHDAGIVLDLFRDSANDLELLDRDERRHAYRDADRPVSDEWQYAHRDADSNDRDEYRDAVPDEYRDAEPDEYRDAEPDEYRDAEPPIEINLDAAA